MSAQDDASKLAAASSYLTTTRLSDILHTSTYAPSSVVSTYLRMLVYGLLHERKRVAEMEERIRMSHGNGVLETRGFGGDGVTGE